MNTYTKLLTIVLLLTSFAVSSQTINIGPDTILCHNSSYTLRANGNYNSYIWNDGSTNDTLIVNTQNADTSWYSVTVTNGSGSFSDSTLIIVLDSLTVQLSADTTLCAYDSTLIETTTSFDSYLWNTGDTTNSLSAIASNMNSGDTTFSVLVTDTNQCHALNSIDVTIYPEVIVDLGPDTVFADSNAQGSFYVLDAGAGFSSYLWPDNSSNQTYYTDDNDWSEIFWVIVTDTNGCQGTDTVIVTFLFYGNIKDFEKGNVNIFPNPATDFVQVELENLPYHGSYEIVVYSLNGASVLEDEVFYSGIEITKRLNVSTLKPGNYMVKISSKNWMKSVSIIVQH